MTFNRIVLPLLIPLTAMLTAGILIYGISRILIGSTKEVAPPIALGIAVVVLLGGALAYARLSHEEPLD